MTTTDRAAQIEAARQAARARIAGQAPHERTTGIDAKSTVARGPQRPNKSAT